MKLFGMSVYMYAAKGLGIFGDEEDKVIKPITYREEGLKYCARVGQLCSSGKKSLGNVFCDISYQHDDEY